MSKISTFLKEVKLEMGRVNWPTKEQTIKYTMVVIGMSVFVAIFLGALDFIFARILTILIS
jgi:preprotein translocase subunit SecE